MGKTLNIVKNIFVCFMVVFAVGMMIFTIISVNTFDQAHRSFMGYKAFIVRTDSMSATDFDAGDLVLIRNVDPAELMAGDIIAFTSQDDESYGETVTHKIRSLVTNAEGEPGFVTYGTTTGADDEVIVTHPYVLGKYAGKIPNMGTFFLFLKTTPGYIMCIFVPFVLLILYQGVTCVQLFRRYKREQMAEMEAERAALAEERRQSAEMMAELQALKEQLAARDGQAPEQ